MNGARTGEFGGVPDLAFEVEEAWDVGWNVGLTAGASRLYEVLVRLASKLWLVGDVQ